MIRIIAAFLLLACAFADDDTDRLSSSLKAGAKTSDKAMSTDHSWYRGRPLAEAKKGNWKMHNGVLLVDGGVRQLEHEREMIEKKKKDVWKQIKESVDDTMKAMYEKGKAYEKSADLEQQEIDMALKKGKSIQDSSSKARKAADQALVQELSTMKSEAAKMVTDTAAELESQKQKDRKQTAMLESEVAKGAQQANIGLYDERDATMQLAAKKNKASTFSIRSFKDSSTLPAMSAGKKSSGKCEVGTSGCAAGCTPAACCSGNANRAAHCCCAPQPTELEAFFETHRRQPTQLDICMEFDLSNGCSGAPLALVDTKWQATRGGGQQLVKSTPEPSHFELANLKSCNAEHVFLNEVHPDPKPGASDHPTGQWFEVHNTGPRCNMNGFELSESDSPNTHEKETTKWHSFFKYGNVILEENGYDLRYRNDYGFDFGKGATYGAKEDSEFGRVGYSADGSRGVGPSDSRPSFDTSGKGFSLKLCNDVSKCDVYAVHGCQSDQYKDTCTDGKTHGHASWGLPKSKLKQLKAHNKQEHFVRLGSETPGGENAERHEDDADKQGMSFRQVQVAETYKKQQLAMVKAASAGCHTSPKVKDSACTCHQSCHGCGYGANFRSTAKDPKCLSCLAGFYAAEVGKTRVCQRCQAGAAAECGADVTRTVQIKQRFGHEDQCLGMDLVDRKVGFARCDAASQGKTTWNFWHVEKSLPMAGQCKMSTGESVDADGQFNCPWRILVSSCADTTDCTSDYLGGMFYKTTPQGKQKSLCLVHGNGDELSVAPCSGSKEEGNMADHAASFWVFTSAGEIKAFADDEKKCVNLAGKAGIFTDVKLHDCKQWNKDYEASYQKDENSKQLWRMKRDSGITSLAQIGSQSGSTNTCWGGVFPTPETVKESTTLGFAMSGGGCFSMIAQQGYWGTINEAWISQVALFTTVSGGTWYFASLAYGQTGKISLDTYVQSGKKATQRYFQSVYSSNETAEKSTKYGSVDPGEFETDSVKGNRCMKAVINQPVPEVGSLTVALRQEYLLRCMGCWASNNEAVTPLVLTGKAMTWSMCNKNAARTDAELSNMFGVSHSCARGTEKAEKYLMTKFKDPVILSERGWAYLWEWTIHEWIMKPNKIDKRAKLYMWKKKMMHRTSTVIEDGGISTDYLHPQPLRERVAWRIGQALFKNPNKNSEDYWETDYNGMSRSLQWKTRHTPWYADASGRDRTSYLVEEMARSSDAGLAGIMDMFWALQTGMCEDRHSKSETEFMKKLYPTLPLYGKSDQFKKYLDGFLEMLPGFLEKVYKKGIGTEGMEWTKKFVPKEVLGELIGAFDLPHKDGKICADPNTVDGSGILSSIKSLEVGDWLTDSYYKALPKDAKEIREEKGEAVWQAHLISEACKASEACQCVCPGGVAPPNVNCAKAGKLQCASCNAGYSPQGTGVHMTCIGNAGFKQTKPVDFSENKKGDQIAQEWLEKSHLKQRRLAEVDDEKFENIGAGICTDGKNMLARYEKSHGQGVREQCEKACSDTWNCLGYNFVKTNKKCLLYAKVWMAGKGVVPEGFSFKEHNDNRVQNLAATVSGIKKSLEGPTSCYRRLTGAKPYDVHPGAYTIKMSFQDVSFDKKRCYAAVDTLEAVAKTSGEKGEGFQVIDCAEGKAGVFDLAIASNHLSKAGKIKALLESASSNDELTKRESNFDALDSFEVDGFDTCDGWECSAREWVPKKPAPAGACASEGCDQHCCSSISDAPSTSKKQSMLDISQNATDGAAAAPLKRELWAMITSGNINDLSRYFRDKIDNINLFPDMVEFKIWKCEGGDIGDNPFHMLSFVREKTIECDFFAASYGALCTAQAQYPCNGMTACDRNCFSAKTALSAAIPGGNWPLTGHTAAHISKLEDLLYCDINLYGVARIGTKVLANTFWGTSGNWDLTLAATMLISSQHDQALLNLLPADYKSSLENLGYPDLARASQGWARGEPGKDYFGLNYGESFMVSAATQLRGYVYNCLTWHEQRGNGVANLGARITADCLNFFSSSRETYCNDYQEGPSYTAGLTVICKAGNNSEPMPLGAGPVGARTCLCSEVTCLAGQKCNTAGWVGQAGICLDTGDPGY